MPKGQPRARRSRKKAAKDKAMTGPKSLYRGKVRRPLTLLLTPDGIKREERVREKTGLSRGDLYEFLLVTFGDRLEKLDGFQTQHP